MYRSAWTPPHLRYLPEGNNGHGRQSLSHTRGLNYIPVGPRSTNMTVCKFWLENRCRFGDSCKNEHSNNPQGNRSGGFGGGLSNNRFGAFGGDSYRPAQQSGGRNSSVPRFNLDDGVIKSDLTNERPIYPISCYGPGRDAPRQLIEGPVEVSPEELRSRYYLARRTGNEMAAQQEQTQLAAKMDAQVKAVLDDLKGAVRYIEAGTDVHPNRLDIVAGKAPFTANNSNNNAPTSNPLSQQPANPFSGGAKMQTPAFGQPGGSTFGQPSNQGQGTAFGQPSKPGQTTAFGQPSNPGQTTAFGQPSHPGQTSSAFGQASNPGQTSSPFGQPSALGGTSAFGKPSVPGGGAFGQPATPSAFGSSGFGKPSMPGAGAAFGQASTPGQQSAFGQTSAPGASSGFGKPSMPGQTSAFGQPSAPGQGNAFAKPAFGQTGFGQTSQPGATSSPFGQQSQANKPNPFGQAQSSNQPSPFGQQTQTTTQSSPFGQAQQQNAAQSSPFGGASAAQKPSPFAQASNANASPFAPQNQTSTAPSSAPNPFNTKPPTLGNTPSPFGAQTQTSSVFGQSQTTQAPSPFSQPAGAARPATTSNTTAASDIDPRDRLKEGKPEEYDGEQGKLLEEIYLRVAQTGFFNDNEDIPLTPPKCEWIVPVV
ncbi:unnamed protein product [Periconia digitata]|uniref:C3H1-type domain-containing protein n=1 Tax=Periconia digitata TaxID=1303443 RepID=A0A9W4UMN8_9PLEO|nr:unnamed protein product [Periconia digitata]